MARSLRLVYIVGTYPLVTTTFIDREIQMLREWGVDIQIMAVRRPADDAPLSADQRKLQEGVVYLLPAAWLTCAVSQLYFALLRPRRYLATLFYLLTRPHPRVRVRYLTPRFMTLLHFVEGICTAFILRRQQFDGIHAHFVDRAATIALVVGRMMEKQYSLSIHAGPDVFVDPVLLREKILEARHVVTCTRYGQSYIEKSVGLDLGCRISHIRHGLDLTKYCPPSSTAHGQTLVLSVGQLSERKGFVDLVRACRTLRDQGYRFSCEIVGEGPLRQELEELIAELSLQDTVALCGALSHEQVVEKYKHAWVFVLPCRMSRTGNLDGIPNVLAEAMAMQVPVISTSLTAITELIEDQLTGVLVPPGDSTALASAIARLLDDPALRERLGQEGRRSVQALFDIKRNIHRLAVTLWPDWFVAERIQLL